MQLLWWRLEWFSSCGLLPPTAMRPTQQQRLLIHFLSSPEKTHLSLHTYLYFQPQKRFHQKTTHSIFLNYRFKSVHKSITEPCTKTITRNSRLHLRPQRLLIPPFNQRWPLVFRLSPPAIFNLELRSLGPPAFVVAAPTSQTVCASQGPVVSDESSSTYYKCSLLVLQVVLRAGARALLLGGSLRLLIKEQWVSIYY